MVGKLIVLDGADGAGKATQTRLLVERLRSEGHQVRTMDFPRYDTNRFGRLICECLDGKRGDFLSLDPKIASALYAADRFESSPQLHEWLGAGDSVILDRYVSANMLHQGGKLADEEELREFLTWLDDIEHGVFGLPRPDLVLYLEVPFSYRHHMVQSGQHRTYTDAVDVDQVYQERVEQNALRLTAHFNEWRTIPCVEAGELLSREVIHERIVQAVLPVLQ